MAREKLRHEVPKKASDYPLTLDAADSPFLLRILTAQHSVLLADTKDEKEWPSFKGHTNIRSWLCVPLVASQQTLGLLSVGHTQPNTFTQDHLRRTQLLAIPAAAAIQNSRLYERAEIFGSELQRRLTDLRQTEKALEQSEEGRRVSEDKFQKVFRSSPIPFSITTVNEGRFVDVNAAFERRYGYSRAEVIGRTVGELGIWEDPEGSSLDDRATAATGADSERHHPASDQVRRSQDYGVFRRQDPIRRPILHSCRFRRSSGRRQVLE